MGTCKWVEADVVEVSEINGSQLFEYSRCGAPTEEEYCGPHRARMRAHERKQAKARELEKDGEPWEQTRLKEYLDSGLYWRGVPIDDEGEEVSPP